MPRLLIGLCILFTVSAALHAQQPAKQADRLGYQTGLDPYYPHAKFPRLTTPQWLGEEGVDAVVVLAIDDMRDPQKYEAYLRPIINRLKKIDGRAGLSIMTCQVKNTRDPLLQKMAHEGVSFENHTVAHPCPFFKIGYDKALATVQQCNDPLRNIKLGLNRPTAFRMPCCDSLNTPSPRFWYTMFPKTGLSIDSSVFNIFTSADPDLPKSLTLVDGKERFTKYVPYDRSFVNWIENYPYPYLISNDCWQFPCVTPSDWQAFHLHKANNPITVADWKAAIDCTVIKKGVFCLVFHPHGWIKNDHVVDIIDYAVEKYGKRVKFMSFLEAIDALQKTFVEDRAWQDRKSSVRLVDVNGDGYLDFVSNRTALWLPEKNNYQITYNPFSSPAGGQFGILRDNNVVSFYMRMPEFEQQKLKRLNDRIWHFDGKNFIFDKAVSTSHEVKEGTTRYGYVLRDIDGDGISERIGTDRAAARFVAGKGWQDLPFQLPIEPRRNPMALGHDPFAPALCFLDLNGDNKLDLLFSDENGYGLYLFTDMKQGWSQKVRAGKKGDPDAIPAIAENGQDMGFFRHSGYLWWANENTHLLKNHVDRRKISELLHP